MGRAKQFVAANQTSAKSELDQHIALLKEKKVSEKEFRKDPVYRMLLSRSKQFAAQIKSIEGIAANRVKRPKVEKAPKETKGKKAAAPAPAAAKGDKEKKQKKPKAEA